MTSGLEEEAYNCYQTYYDKIDAHQVIENSGENHYYDTENQSNYSSNQTYMHTSDAHQLSPPEFNDSIMP
jgi:hypothetical protein